jgi:hypothetical protein
MTLVGEAPGRVGDARRVLAGRCGQRLARLAGLTDAEYACLRRRNVLARWPGAAAGGGARFPLTEARRAASAMHLRGTVLLLGHRVAAAFGIRAPYFAWSVRGAAQIAVFPHPSGVNRYWNSAAAARRAAAFLRAALDMDPRTG